MRTILLFLLAIIVSSTEVFGEIKSFRLTGEIKGSQQFKFAYLFNNEHKLIKRLDIRNKTFEAEGTFNTQQCFGELPTITLLLSDKDAPADAILADRPLSRRRYYTCRIICEDKISVIYNSEKKIFNILGNEQNSLQSQFNQLDILFLTQRDSSNIRIEMMPLVEKEKSALKESQARSIYQATLAKMASLIGEHPNSEVSLNNLGPIVFDQHFSAAKTAELFEKLSAKIKTSAYGIQIRKIIDDKFKNESVISSPTYTVGMSFPQFSLPNSQGIQFSSTSISSKFTLIDFWATWCVPCRKETPNLIQAYKAYRDKGFQILTVSIDDQKDRNKWIATLKQDGMADFINLFNGNDISGLAAELKVIAIPANYLIDGSGKIIAMNLREETLTQFLSGQYAKENTKKN